jgi:hypothetical protein
MKIFEKALYKHHVIVYNQIMKTLPQENEQIKEKV